MWSFRAYLKDKCADPEFLDQYHEQCTICPTTVMIISEIREKGISNKDVAKSSGVEIEHLELLESAESCSYDDVLKLASFLNLPLSDVCKKTIKNREKS